MCKKLQAIEEEREYLTYKDIMSLFACGEAKAREIIRNIRNKFGDTLPKGKVLISEYKAWKEGAR